MRSRLLLALLMAFVLSGVALVPSFAHAATVLAQEDGTENENAEGGEDTEGEGQSDADAETGASEEEAEGGASSPEEEGPPWTYQMARISLLLILFFLLGMGLLYYKLIGSRQRGSAG